MPQVPGVNAIIDDGTAAANAHASDWRDANPFESVIDSCWCQVLLLLILGARHIEFVHTMCGSATIRRHPFCDACWMWEYCTLPRNVAVEGCDVKGIKIPPCRVASEFLSFQDQGDCLERLRSRLSWPDCGHACGIWSATSLRWTSAFPSPVRGALLPAR